MDEYTTLARQAVETYVASKQELAVPARLPAEFYQRPAGVFVTILNQNELRGCVGTFLPTRPNIAQEIITNAIAAATRDYRFWPITKNELPDLVYEVSILSAPRALKDRARHNPEIHGLIVQSTAGRSGLLLPNLAGVNTFEQQLLTACQKGGINPATDKLKLFYFTVEKYH